MPRTDLLRMIDQLESILLKVETGKNADYVDVLVALRVAYRLANELVKVEEKLEKVKAAL